MNKPEPSQQRGRQRRAALARAALDLLEEGGYAAVSHRSVAERAGVPLGSTTYYFSSLDDLLGAAAELAAQDLDERGQAILAELGEEDRSADQVADLLLDAVMRGSDTDALVSFYEQLLGAARRPAVAAVWDRARPRFEAVIAGILERTGYADRIGPNVTLALVDGAIVGAVSEGCSDVCARARETLVEALECR